MIEYENSGQAEDAGASTEPVTVTITVKEVRESPRRPGRYTLVLSDGRTLTLGIAALSDSGATRAGVVLEPSLLGGLVRESAITELTDRALGVLARGRRTRRELEQRLRRREPDLVMVNAALDRLEASGALSDSDVAHAEAAARLRRGEAPSRVRQTLRMKGIGDRDAAHAVSNAVEQENFDELSACRAVAEKRMRALGKLEPTVARRRLTAFLARRGFGGSVLHAVLTEQFRRNG
ncbi:MAG TPA: regulatory protein RecX [Gemmatimonas sp.]|nr:regulatory protein RecX [Gemmatimonas sp.]